MKYVPVRDLVLVEKIEEEKSIIMPENSGTHFIRLKVLSVGREVDATIKTDRIIWAENLLERIKPGENKYLILAKYIVCIEEENGKS